MSCQREAAVNDWARSADSSCECSSDRSSSPGRWLSTAVCSSCCCLCLDWSVYSAVSLSMPPWLPGPKRRGLSLRCSLDPDRPRMQSISPGETLHGPSFAEECLVESRFTCAEICQPRVLCNKQNIALCVAACAKPMNELHPVRHVRAPAVSVTFFCKQAACMMMQRLLLVLLGKNSIWVAKSNLPQPWDSFWLLCCQGYRQILPLSPAMSRAQPEVHVQLWLSILETINMAMRCIL